jgi:hypothetical protein
MPQVPQETQDVVNAEPGQSTDSSRITTFLVGFTLLLFVGLVALACPPVKTTILASSPPVLRSIIQSMRQSPDVWSDWLPFGELLAEVVLGLLLGGALIVELVANYVHRLLADIGGRAATHADTEVQNAIERLWGRVTDVREAAARRTGVKIGGLLRSTLSAYHEANSFARNAPWLLMLVGTAAVLRHFPRGLFGVLTVITFFSLTACKVADIYLEKVTPSSAAQP